MYLVRIRNFVGRVYFLSRQKRAARKLGFELVFAASDLEPMRRISDKVFACATPAKAVNFS